MAEQGPLEDDLPRQPPAWTAWLETLLISAAPVLIGRWLRPADPFFSQASFAWSVLAPLLAGIRYGFAYGLGSALLIVLGMASAWRWKLVPVAEFPAELALGLLAAGMVAGEFSDLWRRRIQRLGMLSEYRRARLDEFARGYHLLKVSHDALELRVAGTTQNMREALMTLRSELQHSGTDGGQPLSGLGKRVLGLFQNYGWVQIAALFLVEGKDLEPVPVETLGSFGDVPAGDPLLQDCLRQRKMLTIRQEGGGVDTGTRLLAAIPLVDVHGRVWAIVAVRQMLFVAFQWENLKLLAVLGGHIGDILSFGTRMYLGEASGRREFADHLRRALNDRRVFDLPASVVTFALGGQAPEDLGQSVLRQRRGLDQAILLRDRDGNEAVFVLLCLSDENAMHGYLVRVDGLAKERYGSTLEEMGVRIGRHPLQRRGRAEELLAHLCRQCNVSEES